MESSFGVLDAFAFVVFAVLIGAGVIIVVSLGQLPGRLARKWDHPQAAALGCEPQLAARNRLISGDAISTRPHGRPSR
jgi:hypothetical protein